LTTDIHSTCEKDIFTAQLFTHTASANYRQFRQITTCMQ